MGVSGQRHAPAALYPRGNDPRYPLYRRLGKNILPVVKSEGSQELGKSHYLYPEPDESSRHRHTLLFKIHLILYSYFHLRLCLSSDLFSLAFQIEKVVNTHKHIRQQPTYLCVCLFIVRVWYGPSFLRWVENKNYKRLKKKCADKCEISSSHGGEYDVQSCLLGCTAV
jgi:hypothetical protein